MEYSSGYTFKMLQHLSVALCLVIGVTSVCDYRNDLSPFFWKNEANVCTKELCTSYNYLKCHMTREEVMDQALAHMPEDILYETEQMKAYFDTLIPRPANVMPYNCKGVCQNGAAQLKLQRIFTTVNVRDATFGGALVPRNMMCIVIGPDIYYEQCGGQCDLKDSFGRYCVPDVTVKVKLWVYCPGEVQPACHKVDFDVPLSCTCKKITCQKGVSFPAFNFSPNLPVAPPNWAPGHGAGMALGVLNGGALGAAMKISGK